MKKLLVITLAFVLISGTCSAAEPGGWSTGLFIGEVGAGAGAGVLAGIGFALIRAAFYHEQTNDYLMDDVFYFVLVGYGLGAAGGTLLVGEVFGAKSENKATTYLGTAGVGLATSGLFAGTVFLLDKGNNDDAAVIVAYSSLVLTPVTTAIMYNVFKKPEVKEEAAIDVGFEFNPTTGYMADSGGKFIPTYGVEIAF